MDPKLTILMGGRTMTVQFADGTTHELQVRQIPIGDYERGFVLVEDEIALVGFLCGEEKAWAANLCPESYETILATGREVNDKGFFAWSRRRSVREQEKQAAMYAALGSMSPETLKLAVEMGAQATSPTSSPRVVRKLI